MIRVLQVVGTMDLGGAETFIMNLYRNIDRAKIQFDFLCHNRIEAKYTEEILSMGGKMYCVPGIRHVGLLRYQKNLYKFFAEHPEYKVVHSHQNILSGMILRQAKKAGVPNRFAHAHYSYEPVSILKKMEMLFWKSFFPKNVTRAFACAIKAGNSLFMGKLKHEFEFIPNAIDVNKMRYNVELRERILSELNIKEAPVIGHIGRFAHQKNHRFVLEIFSKILIQKPSAHLILIGDGELKQEIMEYAGELGVAQMAHFIGSRNDVPACLCAIDLYLFPSFGEGLSVACVEAQASGLPILTSTSVSSEVAITDLVWQESLSKSAEEWADIAIEMIEANKGNDRSIYADKVKNAGFDVKELAMKMQDIYLKSSELY